MVLLEHQTGGVRERALALFAGKAQRAIGLRGEVVVFITNSRYLQKLNLKFRGKDEPTDVLSFPAEHPKQAGDISISAEIAAENAAVLGHSAETELRILILHGLLHLAGYDHETDNGKMQALEAQLRQQFKLPAGLIERAHGVKPDAEALRPRMKTRKGQPKRVKHDQQPHAAAAVRRVKASALAPRNGGGRHR